MYKIPDLIFIKDESIEYGNKIDEMLRNLERKISENSCQLWQEFLRYNKIRRGLR